MGRPKKLKSYIQNATGLEILCDQETKISCIYLLANNTDKIAYIGLTKDLAMRISQHEHCLRNEKHANPQLQDWVSKNGLDNLSVFILEMINADPTKNKDFFESKEQHYVKLLNKLSYNVCNVLESSKERRNKTAPTGLSPRKTWCRDLSTQEIQIFESTSEAARQTGLSQGAISEAARGHFGSQYKHGGTNVYRGKEWFLDS